MLARMSLRCVIAVVLAMILFSDVGTSRTHHAIRTVNRKLYGGKDLLTKNNGVMSSKLPESWKALMLVSTLTMSSTFFPDHTIADSRNAIDSIESKFHSSSSTLSDEATLRKQIIRDTENLLTNPLLESYRKATQLDPDADPQEINKTFLLFPIIEIQRDVQNVLAVLKEQPTKESFTKITQILSQNKYEKATFKKIFNRYSDNIFYQDPRRANLYLAGGAMPSSTQTQQYLYRNEALTSITNVRDDVNMLLNDVSIEKQAVDDTIDDCLEAVDALTSYLRLADPRDVVAATDLLKISSNSQ
jgi:hypothetical protein